MYVEYLRDDSVGVVIGLSGSDDPGLGAEIEIAFEETELYRNTSESFLLRSIDYMAGVTGHTLYLVENSPLKGWLVDESLGVWDMENAKHYAIYTQDDCIDVISSVEPVVRRVRGG